MTYEEMGTTLQWKKNLLFAGIFIQENLLHTVFDRYNTMSCKQWLLMSVLKAFDTPPDLSAAAKAMGCSRQNVKQLARHWKKTDISHWSVRLKMPAAYASPIRTKDGSSAGKIPPEAGLSMMLFFGNFLRMRLRTTSPCL